MIEMSPEGCMSVVDPVQQADLLGDGAGVLGGKDTTLHC